MWRYEMCMCYKHHTTRRPAQTGFNGWCRGGVQCRRALERLLWFFFKSLFPPLQFGCQLLILQWFYYFSFPFVFMSLLVSGTFIFTTVFCLNKFYTFDGCVCWTETMLVFFSLIQLSSFGKCFLKKPSWLSISISFSSYGASFITSDLWLSLLGRAPASSTWLDKYAVISMWSLPNTPMH